MNLMNLKIYRNVYGYTQEDLAKVLGVTKTSYANKETGRRKITLTESRPEPRWAVHSISRPERMTRVSLPR